MPWLLDFLVVRLGWTVDCAKGVNGFVSSFSSLICETFNINCLIICFSSLLDIDSIERHVGGKRNSFNWSDWFIFYWLSFCNWKFIVHLVNDSVMLESIQPFDEELSYYNSILNTILPFENPWHFIFAVMVETGSLPE